MGESVLNVFNAARLCDPSQAEIRKRERQHVEIGGTEPRATPAPHQTNEADSDDRGKKIVGIALRAEFRRWVGKHRGID